MAKTADVYQSIWADPWFESLPPDAKLLYLWAITTPHSNLAGLFVVGRKAILSETDLTPARFDKALAACEGKLVYVEESGTLWVRGRVKRVRSRTVQIAKSIAKAVEECSEPAVQVAFMQKYGACSWLAEAFADLALSLDFLEPHTNLGEVPSQSQSQSQSQGQNGNNNGKNPRDAEWADFIADFRKVSGHEHVTGSKKARGFFNARRDEGLSLADLKLATRGACSDAYLRERNLDRPETILRESNIERYIGLGKKAKRGEARPQHRTAA